MEFSRIFLTYITQKYNDVCLCIRFALINQDYCNELQAINDDTHRGGRI